MSYKSKIVQFSSLYYGAFISQGASLLIYFFAARFLSLDIIGDFFILIALTEIISAAVSMQSHMTILLERERECQIKNLGISLIILIMSSFVLGILMFLFKKKGFLGLDSVNVMIYLPLTVLLHGMFIASEKYSIGQMKFKNISFAKSMKVIVFGGVLLYFHYVGTQKNILVLSYLAGQLVLVIILISPIWSLIYYELRWITFSAIKVFISKYKNILFYNTIISPINTFSNQLLYIFIPITYSKDLVANYGILFKTILFPILLISQINTQLFFKNTSKLFNRKKRIDNYLFAFMKRTLLIGLCLFLVVVILSNALVNEIEYKWQLSVSILNTLVIWLVVNFVKTPISPLITILKVQKKWMVFEISQLILRGVLFVGCYFLQVEIIGAVGLYSILSAVLGVILILIIYNEVLSYEKKRTQYNSITEVTN